MLNTADAEMYRDLCMKLDGETPRRLYEPGERPSAKGIYRQELASLSGPTSHITGAFCGDELIGYIAAYGHTARRMAHCATVAIGILQEHTAHGIGALLFERLENWAGESGITRLELTVLTDNEPAVKLYTRIGFQTEGLRRRSIRRGGEYADEYFMAKLL